MTRLKQARRCFTIHSERALHHSWYHLLMHYSVRNRTPKRIDGSVN